MSLFKYQQPKAEYVQFQRLISGLLVLFGVLFVDIFFIYAFVLLSIVSFITTISHSPTTYIFKILSFIYRKSIFVTPPQYAHSYLVYRLAEVFEDMMRISGGVAIVYIHQYSPITAWIIASFMAIAMLISSFFGFCLSSVLYIGYQNMRKKIKS